MLRDKKSTTAQKAPDALKILWKEGFFLKEKSQKEAEQELHKKGYNFGDTLRKALVSAKFLLICRKKGERKYIQKYPLSEDDEIEKRKRE